MPITDDFKTNQRSDPFCVSLLYYLDSGDTSNLSKLHGNVVSLVFLTSLAQHLQTILINVSLSVWFHSLWLMLSYIKFMILLYQAFHMMIAHFRKHKLRISDHQWEKTFSFTALFASLALLTPYLHLTKAPIASSSWN